MSNKLKKLQLLNENNHKEYYPSPHTLTRVDDA